jgi:hypothetical protein
VATKTVESPIEAFSFLISTNPPQAHSVSLRRIRANQDYEKKDEKVFFTGYKRDSHRFPSHLWERLDPQQAKDNQPQLLTVRPKAGQAAAAFEDWLGRF